MLYLGACGCLGEKGDLGITTAETMGKEVPLREVVRGSLE